MSSGDGNRFARALEPAFSLARKSIRLAFAACALVGGSLFLPSLNRAAAESVCARTDTTLRKGPGTQNPVSWKVSKYMPFVRLEQKNGWTKVQDLEGEHHWARSLDLTGKIRCVAVKTNVAALHKDPNINSPPSALKTVDRYTPLMRVDDQEEWLKVEDEAGHQAWIHESQVWKPVVINTISF